MVFAMFATVAPVTLPGASADRAPRWPGSGFGAAVVRSRRSGPWPAAPGHGGRLPPRSDVPDRGGTTYGERGGPPRPSGRRPAAEVPPPGWGDPRPRGRPCDCRGGRDCWCVRAGTRGESVPARYRGIGRRPERGPEVENRTLKPDVETRRARRASVPHTQGFDPDEPVRMPGRTSMHGGRESCVVRLPGQATGHRRPGGQQAVVKRTAGSSQRPVKAVTVGPPPVHVHLLMHLHMNRAMIRGSWPLHQWPHRPLHDRGATCGPRRVRRG